MKKLTFFKSLIAAIMMTISLGLSAQNTLSGTCPGYCDPSGAGALATATDAFYMLINTETNGDVTFTILGVPNNTTTFFRNNGWADGIITGITVNGDANAGNKYFTRTISSDKKIVTLVKQSDIPADATVHINGILEYKTADTGDESNLWPTVDISFQYGITCNFVQTPLNTPSITNIDADKKITFTGVDNAASYKVFVYRDDALVHSQTVSSGDVINFTPTVTYNYTVKLQAISNDINYSNSAYSDSYTWPLTAESVDLGPSKFCDYVIGSDANSYAYLSWETDANGNVVITISGYAGDTNTSFRSAGLGGDLSKFTVNGNPASIYFTRTYTTGSTTYTLTLKSGASILPGDKISYTGGTVEWKTSKNTNAYKTYTFSDYVYGTDCSSLPKVTVNPSSISFSPTVGTQTFNVTGTNLTGAITITAPRGLTVSPSSISPDGNGEINQTVTVNWTSGTTSGTTIQISGGGLTSNVAVPISTTGFSSFCNKIIYQENTSNNPAYMTIDMSSDKTQMIFSIAPYNEGDGTIWNRIQNIVVNGGTANALVSSNVRSADKTQIIVTFTQALQEGDQITFGNPMVWETNANHNIYINALQGPYTVGQSCNLVDQGPSTSENNILEKLISIFPNPASDHIYFSNKVAKANLFTLQGQKVLSVENSQSVNISNLPKGLYIVKLVDLSGNQQTSKIEVQ
jgi:hypothetical protein